MKLFSKIILPITLLLYGCIDVGKGSATVDDLQLLSGITNQSLILSGTAGESSTFTFKANYDWKIIDYKGFTCTPSSGAKSIGDEVISVIATPTKSNNSADTLRLSDLNFKLLSTRFVGISAYQLPQIIAPERVVYVEAISDATTTVTFKTKCDVEDIELTTNTSNISAKIIDVVDRRDMHECTIRITSHTSNNESTNVELGKVGFKVNGVAQSVHITVMQSSAIALDRSIILLPGIAGGENMFTINSKFEVKVLNNSDKFTLRKISNNTYSVTANLDNKTGKEILLGNISIALKEVPECSISVEVRQRIDKAPQTIVMHFIGTALQYYFENNISTLLQALNANIQGEARIVAITTDSTTDATMYELRYDNILGKAVKEKVKELSLPTPYNRDLFETNLREALKFAPAEKYALIIGSHGLAWVPKSTSAQTSSTLLRMGFNPASLWQRDENAEMTRHIGDREPTRYDITEIAEAIEANNIKFDYILFDACFMGNIESAYELRNVTKYIIGSPCEVMGAGFPYLKVTPYMLTNGGTGYNLDKICSEYVNYYGSDATTASACISVTNIAEIDKLAVAMKDVNKAGIKSSFSLSNVQYYEGQIPHSFYDLGDMVEQSCADATVAAAFKKQLDKCVTSRYHTKQFYSAYGGNGIYYHDINYYSGITTSAMVDHYANDWRNTAWYKATH